MDVLVDPYCVSGSRDTVGETVGENDGALGDSETMGEEEEEAVELTVGPY